MSGGSSRGYSTSSPVSTLARPHTFALCKLQTSTSGSALVYQQPLCQLRPVASCPPVN